MVFAADNLIRLTARPILAAQTQRDFSSFFGTSPAVCALTWNMFDLGDEPGASLRHLLWGLMLMKTYAKESVLCKLAGSVTRTTFRRWAWRMILLIARLKAHVVRLYYCLSLTMLLFFANNPLLTDSAWQPLSSR